MVPMQTGLPLRGLASCGYAADPRSERAYQWLLSQRLPDGAWPTGIAADNYGYVAGYRRLPHSRWGCRSNTTAALICLALHPERRSGAESRRALDLLLGQETKEAHAIGFDLARLIGAEPSRGFITTYARFDLAQILDLCWRVGVSLEDARLAEMVEELFATAANLLTVNFFGVADQTAGSFLCLHRASATQRIRLITDPAGINDLTHVAVTLIVVHRRYWAVDRYLMGVRSAQPYQLRVGVREQAALQERIVGEIDSRHEMARVERNLFRLSW